MGSRNPTITLNLADGIEEELPGKYAVCERCEGRGTHTNPAIDGNGLTAEDIDEAGPDFIEDYLGGVYDVQCELCKGARVVAVPDFARWTVEQRRAYSEQLREEAEYEALVRFERRFQC